MRWRPHGTGEVMRDQYFVQVRKRGTDEVVKQFGPHDERQAEKIEHGISINLNHDEYYTEIVPVDEEQVEVEA